MAGFCFYIPYMVVCMARRRGGQPENVNVVKHGFYSQRFRDLEASDLEGALQDGSVSHKSFIIGVITTFVLLLGHNQYRKELIQ